MVKEILLSGPLNIESHVPKTDPLFGSCKVVILSRLCSRIRYRQSDIGKYAAMLKGHEQDYWLAPGGSTSKWISPRRLLGNFVQLFDEAEDAVFAVTDAWNVFSEEIERDIADHYHNNPIGGVYRLDIKNNELTLLSVMYCHERGQ